MRTGNRPVRAMLAGAAFLVALVSAPPTVHAEEARAQVADPFRGAVIYTGSRLDKGFNQAAFAGATRFTEETGIRVAAFDTTETLTLEMAVAKALGEQVDLLVLLGSYTAPVLTEAASRHPDTRFVIVDGEVSGANIQSILFADEEAGELAGHLAGVLTRSGRVAFLGGMDIPVIRRFEAGFARGAGSVHDGVGVDSRFAGLVPLAFNDPYRGYELTLQMLGQGADIVFAAAGATGLGAYQAAFDSGAMAIGVDTDQNDLFPGTVVASVLKRVDVAVHRVLTAMGEGRWQAGTIRLGVAQGGIGLALTRSTRDLLRARDDRIAERLLEAASVPDR